MSRHTIALLAAAAVSLIVLVGFFGAAWAVFVMPLPAGSKDIATVIFGGLASMAGAVVQFWCGSSVGSMQKTAMMEQRS